MHCSPASAGRPRFDIADIVRAHRVRLEAEESVSTSQRRVLSAIALCRTDALGGHLDVCRSCGYEHPAYNSCRDRHCPKCQALAQEKWIGARAERMLPARHFHVVFTLPSELRSLAKCLPRHIFDALLRAAGATLLELGRSRLEALLGITMVLHTWTRDLRFHPHVHAIVTAGGLALDRTSWRASNENYLFPVQVMGALLRGKVMDDLRRLYVAGALANFDDFRDPEAFDRLMSRLAKAKWVVYAKKPFRRADHVLAYLGRYTHRVGIANSRLVEVSDTAVTFRTKNGNTVTVDPVEFLRRFVQHVLPDGFKKIRHYGLYAASHVDDDLVRAHALLAPPAPATANTNAPVVDWRALLLVLTSRDVTRCPRCAGHLEQLPLPRPRAPPRSAAA